ncbi:MAG: PIG-L family deacetylase [Chloroflexi bacterium]|nr:PIG-L family deacetylase [Chloroflexota bacterium]
MLGVDLKIDPNAPLRVLCLGAHSDDIEIGCGGTLLKLSARYPRLAVDWIVFGASGARGDEARASAQDFLRAVESKAIRVYDFRDGFFPYAGAQIKDHFEELKRASAPDLILTHYRNDLHQDHRLLCELTWNTFRDHLILEYEIPKYDGDLGAPNFFVPLDEPTIQQKIKLLLEHFGTQRSKDWFTADTFRALLRLRGVEARAPTQFAEAFYARKIIFSRNPDSTL